MEAMFFSEISLPWKWRQCFSPKFRYPEKGGNVFLRNFATLKMKAMFFSEISLPWKWRQRFCPKFRYPENGGNVFLRNFATLKTEAMFFSEISLPTGQTPRYHDPQYSRQFAWPRMRWAPDTGGVAKKSIKKICVQTRHFNDFKYFIPKF